MTTNNLMLLLSLVSFLQLAAAIQTGTNVNIHHNSDKVQVLFWYKDAKGKYQGCDVPIATYKAIFKEGGYKFIPLGLNTPVVISFPKKDDTDTGPVLNVEHFKEDQESCEVDETNKTIKDTQERRNRLVL